MPIDGWIQNSGWRKFSACAWVARSPTITPSAGMAIAGACPAKKFARVFAVRRWKSNDVWMARTGYASAAATCACAIAQHPCDRPQVLPAYGLQDSRNEEQNQKTKSNPNTMCLRITPGGNRGTGHFYLAKNRTFLLCVDKNCCFKLWFRVARADTYQGSAENWWPGALHPVRLRAFPASLFPHPEKTDTPTACHESDGFQSSSD